MMYWTNKSHDENNNNFNNMFYIHIWNEKDQNLNFFIFLVFNICAQCYASLSLVGRGVVKWKPHWQAFPFSCLPVDMLKLKLGDCLSTFLLFFHFVAIIDNLGNNLWKCFHYNSLWWKKIAKNNCDKKELMKWRFLQSEKGETMAWALSFLQLFYV